MKEKKEQEKKEKGKIPGKEKIKKKGIYQMVKGTLRESKVLGRTGSQSPYELPCVTRVMYPPQGTELRTTLLQIQSPGEGIWKVQLRHVPASGLAL